MPTIEERLDAIERITALIVRGDSDDGTVPYLKVNARLGMMTDFWCRKPIGQGAALSIGTAIDRFGLYAEIDAGADGFAACPDHPSTAIYAAVVVPHRPGEAQPNIAVEAHAANSPYGNLPYYGDYQYAPQSPVIPTEGVRLVEVDAAGNILRTVSMSANGITLKDGLQAIASWFVQRLTVGVKALWP